MPGGACISEVSHRPFAAGYVGRVLGAELGTFAPCLAAVRGLFVSARVVTSLAGVDNSWLGVLSAELGPIASCLAVRWPFATVRVIVYLDGEVSHAF